jgi:hypothetical protein
VSGHPILTPAQVEAAWRAAYRFSLDDHPNTEIQWEATVWRAFGVPAVADLADDLLAERRADDFDLPGGADGPALDQLLARVTLKPALRLCLDEGLCLLAAIRVVFWTAFREVER